MVTAMEGWIGVRPWLDHGRMALTDRDRAILILEGRFYRYAGVKEQVIRDQFGISATRYYQLLNGLLDNPEALAAAPVTVSRCRRLREARRKIPAGR